jgi:hypothetical protein
MKTKAYDFLIILSALAVIFAALVSILHMEFWLAGTQWMLVGIILATYAIFVKIKTE